MAEGEKKIDFRCSALDYSIMAHPSRAIEVVAARIHCWRHRIPIVGMALRLLVMPDILFARSLVIPRLDGPPTDGGRFGFGTLPRSPPFPPPRPLRLVGPTQFGRDLGRRRLPCPWRGPLDPCCLIWLSW